MKFRNIEAFLAVAENLSFSKAGEQLGISQSAVTLQIKELEAVLGVPLFDRLNKNVSLTAAGEEFSVYAKKVTEETDRVIQSFAGAEAVQGSLKIAVWQTINMLLMPDILAEYHEKYPAVTVSMIEPPAADVFEMLAANEADFAFMIDEPVVRDDMVSICGKKEDLCFVVSPGHPLAAEEHCTLESMAQYEFLLTTRNHTYHKKLMENAAGKNISFRLFVESGNTEPLKRLAEKGVGVALLPEFSIKDSLISGKLIQLQPENFEAYVYRQIVYHKNKWVSPAMRAFFELAASY